MVRSVALLIAAMAMSRPNIPKDEATRYARVLNEIASKHDFDPLLAVAMIHYESHWSPAAASEDGEDYGLGQVRARYFGACRSDEDPVHAPSEACKAAKIQLLVGESNLRQMGSIIGANKKMCAAKAGKTKPEYWIAGYQGLSQPERNKWCTPGWTTTRVMDYHKELLVGLNLVPKPKAIAKPAAASKPAMAAKAGTTPGAAAAKPAAAGIKPGVTASKVGTAAAKPATAAKAGAGAKAAPGAKTAPAVKPAPAKGGKGGKGPSAQAKAPAPRQR